MKKNLITVLALAVAVGLSGLAACSPDKKDDKKGGDVKKTTKVTGDLPNYRYVDLDSVLSRYNLAKDYNEQMLSMQNNVESAARQKENALTNEANRLQKKYENNYTASQEEMAADQQRLAGMQTKAQNEMASLQNNFQNTAMKFQKEINDSVENYIKIYNEKKGYDAIFFKAATLFIDSRLDITDEVVEGLNARYNKKK